MSDNAPKRLQDLAARLVWAIVTIYAVCFVWWNREAADVEVTWWWSVAPSLRPSVLVILGAFLAGFLVTASLTAISAMRHGADDRALRRRISTLEDELQRLRNLPLEEDLHDAPPEPAPGDAESA